MRIVSFMLVSAALLGANAMASDPVPAKPENKMLVQDKQGMPGDKTVSKESPFKAHKPFPFTKNPKLQLCQREVQTEIASFEKNFDAGKKKGLIGPQEEKTLLAAHERLKAMDKRVHEDKKVTPEECQKELGLARAEHAKLAAALKDKGDNGPGKHPIEPPMKKKMP